MIEWTVEESETLSFIVKTGYDWGEVNIRPIKGGVSFTSNSSFGQYAHLWTAIGEQTWQQFLCGCDYYYFMNKAASNHGRIFDVDATIEAIKNHIDEQVLQELLPGPSAEEAKQAISDDFGQSEDAWLMEAWHSDWLRTAYGPDSDPTMIDARYCNCPQAEGFWESVWKPFCAHIKAHDEYGGVDAS